MLATSNDFIPLKERGVKLRLMTWRAPSSPSVRTECGMLHTLRWHASVHASIPEVPHTVTHVLGVGSCGGEGRDVNGVRRRRR